LKRINRSSRQGESLFVQAKQREQLSNVDEFSHGRKRNLMSDEDILEAQKKVDEKESAGTGR